MKIYLNEGCLQTKANTFSGWRKIQKPELKNLILTGKVSTGLVLRLAPPERPEDACLLDQELFRVCQECPMSRAMATFSREFPACKKYSGCKTRGMIMLSHKKRVACTLCQETKCKDKLPDLTRNQPIEVSQDGVSWTRAHAAHPLKDGVAVYAAGGTSCTQKGTEKFRFFRPGQHDRCFVIDAAKAVFKRMPETGVTQVETNMLVTVTPTFKHDLFYTTGKITPEGVEVFSNGRTSWTGGKQTKLILEFPVWKIVEE